MIIPFLLVVICLQTISIIFLFVQIDHKNKTLMSQEKALDHFRYAGMSEYGPVKLAQEGELVVGIATNGCHAGKLVSLATNYQPPKKKKQVKKNKRRRK